MRIFNFVFFPVNLAVALKKLEPDKEIGLLDADVFGPSVPLMMNLNDTPLVSASMLLHFFGFNQIYHPLKYLH